MPDKLENIVSRGHETFHIILLMIFLQLFFRTWQRTQVCPNQGRLSQGCHQIQGLAQITQEALILDLLKMLKLIFYLSSIKKSLKTPFSLGFIFRLIYTFLTGHRFRFFDKNLTKSRDSPNLRRKL